MKKSILLLLIIFTSNSTLFSKKITITNIDQSEYPLIKAEICIYGYHNEQIFDLHDTDFEVRENGKKCELVTISCPLSPKSISSVLAIDNSNSMQENNYANQFIATDAARRWIGSLDYNCSECSIITYSQNSHLTLEWCQDGYLLDRAIDKIDFSNPGTNYNNAFLQPNIGAINMAKTGKYNRIIFFITDGKSCSTVRIEQIISRAQLYRIKIFTMIIGSELTELLNNIASETGGKAYGNINNSTTAEKAIDEILRSEFERQETCQIEWISTPSCTPNVDAQVSYKPLKLQKDFSYIIDEEYLAEITVEPIEIEFEKSELNMPQDTTLTVTSYNSDCNVSNITSSHSDYQISPTSFYLPEGDSQEITITHIPSTYSESKSDFIIEADPCGTSFQISALSPDFPPPEITATAKAFPNIICEQMSTSEIEIQNTGGDTLTITEINLIGTNADEFTISPNLPMVLDTTEIFTLPIQFKPKSIGSKTAQIEIKSNAIIHSEFFVDITAQKDSVLLVPEPINISLGKLFQSQPKDTSIKIINTGSMETVGFATLSENLIAPETAFYVNENENHVFNFTFTGLENETLFNEMITISDTICQNEKEVIISGEITEPTITGFTGKQCVKEEHEYTINLTNPSDNNLNITSIYFDNAGGKYDFDNTLLPINISANTDIPITFSSDEIGIFETKITCQTDNEFIPKLSANASIEAVKFTRSHSSYIENKIHTLANPYPVTYDTTSDYGTRNFIYSIRMHQLDDYFSELISPDTLEIKIDFESNFIAPLITTLELGEQMNSYQVIERKEVEIDPMNARLIIKLAKSESSEIITNDYDLLHIEFTTFLSRNGVGENAIAEIRHEIKSDYFCLDYETDKVSAVILENQCIDDIYIIKPGKDFYFSEIKPNPIDRHEIEIEYGIAFDCHVSIKIYDTAGKLILTPIDEFQTQGDFQKSLSVEELQAGTYFIELEASSFKQTRRIVVE